MPSPFPGMNPYLEQNELWHDFHQRFCMACAEAITPQARPNYIVRLEEHVYIHEHSAVERTLLGLPDVVVTRAKEPGPPRAAAAVIEVPAHAWVTPAVDIERLSYLEVRDRQTRDVVTVIEFLSPTNKRTGEDRVAYVAKRRGWLASSAHFVEVDLLRGGPRMPMEGLPDCAYYALVARAEDRPRMDIWPIRLSSPLPTIPIPLRDPDPDAHLDLKAVLDRVYDAAGYADYIYEGKPQPPLHPEDAAWARQVAGLGG